MTAQCEMNPWDQTFLGVHLQGFVEISILPKVMYTFLKGKGFQNKESTQGN